MLRISELARESAMNVFMKDWDGCAVLLEMVKGYIARRACD